MDGQYFETKEEAASYLLGLVCPGMKVGIGGTQTLEEMGVKKALSERTDIQVYMSRHDVTPQQQEEIYRESLLSDLYLMSSNAITLDGELFNIDGRGNRMAALCYGPKQVYVVAGMNKITADLQSAVKRARNTASPANCNRLDIPSPCSKTGRCSNCMNTTICSQFVYTRHSGTPGRIHLILVGEELGY